ncbi:hypothetical protein [Sinorhizobium medicae]|uniref:hypothetical protein n=1 Tax=Sinorhizobium medicae TaxID=110321 RepID=UPI000FDBA25D|nr:hypothetical protein [Sinorhizobium medicae]RVJ72228.1 hypothetical protein CN168_27215 [Sinorhizobium medicae]
MTINEADIANYIQRSERRLTAIENEISRITRNEGRWETTSTLHPVSTNLSNIREMFLMEIIRQKGLLDDIDLTAIAEKVRAHLAGDLVPWGAKQRTAEKHLQEVIRELAGDYDWSPEREGSQAD